MTEQLANFGTTTLAEDLDASETTVTVTDGSVFPASGNFRVQVVGSSEIMLVTSRSTNDLTVTRGAESTVAATASNGAVIKQRLTAAGLAQAAMERGRIIASSPPSDTTLLWFDTDSDTEAFYDGTRWLTTTQSRLTFARNQISATGELAYAPSFGGVDAWLENAHFSTAVLTTNDTTNKWTVEIYKGVTAGGADASIVSMTTNGDTAGNKVLETVAIGALAGTNAAWYYTFGTKVAAPGDLRCTASITYRLVGT